MLERHAGLRVLYAEDEDSLRIILTDILSSNAGFKVDSCENGEAAIALLKQHTYDVVLLDYKMPVVSGLNVLQWMYEQKMETPTIMLTGAGTETVAVEAMKLGAYDYVRKEYVDIEHLPIIINGVYERYCFKKEKELRTLTAKRNLEAIERFNETVSPISEILKIALAKMSRDVDVYEQNLRPSVSGESHQATFVDLSSIKQDHSIVSFAISSILNITNSLCEKIADDNRIPEKTDGKNVPLAPVQKEQ